MFSAARSESARQLGWVQAEVVAEFVGVAHIVAHACASVRAPARDPPDPAPLPPLPVGEVPPEPPEPELRPPVPCDSGVLGEQAVCVTNVSDSRAIAKDNVRERHPADGTFPTC